MAAGRSDFSQTHTFPQAEVSGLGAPPWPPGAGDAAAAGTLDAGRQITGFAMRGAGAGRPDRDRQRYAWLYDDEDIWRADSVDCVPPMIWGDDWRAPRA